VSEAIVRDCVIIGAGPAGLSAALNLVRARRSTMVLDSNRPRNSATFRSHGFLSRDGISPLELRRLGREELQGYPEASYEKSVVASVTTDGQRFTVTHSGGTVETATVVLATGLREVFPRLPTLRAFYGTSIHSCMECDGYEYADRPIALLGESADLAERALLLTQWSSDLVVFTNGSDAVTRDEQADLESRGIRVERGVVADVTGDRDGLTGVQLVDGAAIGCEALFVRPQFETALDYVSDLGVRVDADGYVTVDADGRTSVAGVYAIGDLTPPGPTQLIVAAGRGGHVASIINRDLLGLARS
jgi:thioredoxin reductase